MPRPIPNRQNRRRLPAIKTTAASAAAAVSGADLAVVLAVDVSDRSRFDWQNDAKHYEFWVQGDVNGHFTIPNIRPGTYQLHAIADGVLGEFSQQPIEIKPGQSLDLGKLEWKPVRYGKQLWDIGIPNRTGSEFLKGDEYFRWGWYVEYPQAVPQRRSLRNRQVGLHERLVLRAGSTRHEGRQCYGPRGKAAPRLGPLPFDLPEQPKGKATLRLAICGCGTRSLDVAVNDAKPFTINMPPYNATINRDGDRGLLERARFSV